jgi:hypothetical protein
MRTVPSVPKPGYLQSIVDPVFGSTVTRITGDPGAAIPTVGGTWGDATRHNYSKDAVWNADESLMVLKRVSGAWGHLILNGTTYTPMWLRGGPGGETRWHPQQPDLMIFLTTSCSFGHWNVRTNATTVVRTVSGYSSCQLGPWEGNASQDGRWVVAQAVRTGDGKRVAFAVDLVNNQKYSDIDLVAQGVLEADNISISALGNYIVANGNISGATALGGATDATRVFTRDGVAVGPAWLEYGRPSHYDLSVDASGNEVAVGVDKVGPATGKVVMRRLSDGLVTVLNVGGYSDHHSTRNLQRPGWAFVSHPYDGPNYPPFRDEIFAVKLDGSLQVERYAHLHATNANDYEAQPQVVPSPSGTRMIFASTWDAAGSRPVQAYVADIRSLCSSRPAAPTNVRVVGGG